MSKRTSSEVADLLREIEQSVSRQAKRQKPNTVASSVMSSDLREARLEELKRTISNRLKSASTDSGKSQSQPLTLTQLRKAVSNSIRSRSPSRSVTSPEEVSDTPLLDEVKRTISERLAETELEKLAVDEVASEMEDDLENEENDDFIRPTPLLDQIRRSSCSQSPSEWQRAISARISESNQMPEGNDEQEDGYEQDEQDEQDEQEEPLGTSVLDELRRKLSSRLENHSSSRSSTSMARSKEQQTVQLEGLRKAISERIRALSNEVNTPVVTSSSPVQSRASMEDMGVKIAEGLRSLSKSKSPSQKQPSQTSVVMPSRSFRKPTKSTSTPSNMKALWESSGEEKGRRLSGYLGKVLNDIKSTL